MIPYLRFLLAVGVVSALASSVPAETIAFDPATLYPTGHVPEPVAVGDLNGDGKADVVVANTAADGEPGGSSVSVFLGNGDGTFAKTGDFDVDGKRPEGITLAFIDNDSNLDCITSNFASNNISVLLGNGDGTFGIPRVTSNPGGPRFVVAGDFDSDGTNDLATSNYDSDRVASLKGSGDGSFSVTKTIPVGRAPEMLAVGNLTPDSFLDLISCNRFDDTLTPLEGKGDGDFDAGSSYDVGDEPRFVVMTDLNGDGLDELIVANNASHNLSIEENKGSLEFSRANILTFPNSSLILREPVYVAMADMNGDGDEDILATWAASNVFTIFAQTQGAFNFGPPTVVQTGTTPLGIAAADFNSDGLNDVFVTNALDDTASVYNSYTASSGVVVDNGDAGTQATGPWSRSDTPFFIGRDALFSKDGTRYSWTARVEDEGLYEVMLWWTVTPGRSESVPVEVNHADGSSSLFVDQTKEIGVWHSLGVYSVARSCTVTITAPQGDKSVSADAIRLRKVSGAPAVLRGSVSIKTLSRPKDYKLSENSALAFQGRIKAESNAGGETIVAALFAPIGAGSESTRITQLKLFADSNANHIFDAGDRQLGDPRSFLSDIRTVVFDGFRETIADDASLDLFVLAELAPAAVVSKVREGATPLLAFGAAMGAALLLRKRRNGMIRLATAGLLLGLTLFLPLSGCKGGGGGGGNGGGSQDLQLQFTSIVAEGQDTNTPSVETGLPVAGWRF